MADKVIGLDIGSNAVRAVALSMGSRPRLQLMGQVGLPPGAVKEGEVVEPAAVAEALRQLWKEVGFKSRSVRDAIASARVILRVVDMPPLSDGDTRAALRFQLSDYIPLPPEATVFDFQPLPPLDGDDGDGGDGGGHEGDGERGRQLLLAAAPRVAVEPLVLAVKQAGLRLSAVDVVAAALARTIPPAAGGPGGRLPVEAVISIGAETIVVVVARAGQPVFARTVTNVSGRQVTDRIATELAIQTSEAERLKRHLADDTPPDVAARVLLATDPHITEITEEIGDSLDYYASQPGAAPLDRVAITGGGSLLTGLQQRLERRLGVPVLLADPFEGLVVGSTGFGTEDLPHLAPFMAVAVGAALGASSAKDKRLDLTPELAPLLTRKTRRPVVIGGIAAAVVVGGAYLYLGQAHALAGAKADRSELEQQVARAQAAAAQRTSSATVTGAGDAAAGTVAAYARTGDADWTSVGQRLDALGEPLGITISGLTGTGTTPAASNGAAAPGVPATTTPATTAPAGTTTPGSTTPGATTPAGAGTASGITSPAASATASIGQASLTGTGPDLDTIAAWVDAVSADRHFADVWVSTTTKTTGTGGAEELQFTATVVLDQSDVVARKLPEASQP